MRISSILAGLALVIALPVRPAGADSASVALFERSLAPSYVWGQNGLLLTPIADTLGKWNLGISTSYVNAGKIQGDQVFDTKGTFAIDTNGYFEAGYTRKALTFPGTFESTRVSSDIFHLKSKLVDLETPYLPKAAIGAFAFNVNGGREFKPNDVFFNGFAVLQEDLPISEKHMFRLHAGAQTGMLGASRTDPFAFGGVDLLLFERIVSMAVEVQGASRVNESGIVNAGLALNLMRMVQVGVGAFNLANFGAERERTEFMFQASVNMPLDRMYKGLTAEKEQPAADVPATPASPQPEVAPAPPATEEPPLQKPDGEPQAGEKPSEKPPKPPPEKMKAEDRWWKVKPIEVTGDEKDTPPKDPRDLPLSTNDVIELEK